MIKGVKVIERSGKNGRVIHFQYKGVEYWNTTENFEEMQEEDFIKLHEESMKDKERWAEIDNRIATKHDSMTTEERERQDESDRVVFERWQDEANTNAILDGYESEKGEDPDFNPFRKK